jgi:hypothetical protein
MGLSEEDRKRIEEEEFRSALREKFERESRVSGDVRPVTNHQSEIRGLPTEIYRDIKRCVLAVTRFVSAGIGIGSQLVLRIGSFVIRIGSELLLALVVSSIFVFGLILPLLLGIVAFIGDGAFTGKRQFEWMWLLLALFSWWLLRVIVRWDKRRRR